jgi:CO/xanthine dehydrogenase Mo-binding subunit
METIMSLVGKNVLRREGPEKLCGLAKFIDDYRLPGCLYGATLRAAIPHGNIVTIRFDPRFPWDETVIVTARDIPGENVVSLIENDQPLLADKKVMHREEPLLVVGHPRREKAYAALDSIHVDYEELDPILDMEQSLRREGIIAPPDNVLKRLLIQKGDIDSGFARSDIVIEGEYSLPHQEQAYIENNGMAAWEEEDGTLVVMGSLQCPFYVHRALSTVFARPNDKIRVIQTTTGGGFGGKEDYPSLIAGHAALLATKAKRPVKMIYDRHEDMLATTKRHPARVRHRTGVTRNGKLVAQEIDVVMDAGAYVTLSPVVLSRGILHATGPYECPNVRIQGRAVATNTPPNGAFRGFGAPQTLFAAELQMEKIAATIGIDPVTLRRRNIFRQGSVTATGQVLRESVGASNVLDSVVTRSRYSQKKKDYARWNRKRSHPTWRGMGISVVFHGAGFTGGGEDYLASRAGVSLTREGEILIEAASTEIGQGTTSMFNQIVAETLGLPLELVRVQTPDTSKVPNSGPTVASRTCMIVGNILRRAALELKDKIEKEVGHFPRTGTGLKKAAKRCRCSRVVAQYEKPQHVQWDEIQYKGDAYGVYGYGAVAVDLEVDKLTYEVHVRKVVAAADVGKAIHPRFVEGQIMGGTAQALGYALLENAVYEKGCMQNAQLTDYIIPTALDTPLMEVDIIEKPYSKGPFGAKGVGELPMDVPAPAVAAAVFDATGAFITRLPVLPEVIYQAIQAIHD